MGILQAGRMSAVATLLFVSAIAPLAAGPAGRVSSVRIANFGEVNKSYYRGAQPVGRDYADLAALGIKTVIDLTGDGEADATEQESVEAAGMTFYRIPMSTHRKPRLEDVEQFLKLSDDSANKPVYVHCQGGRHRTGVMTAVYRMTRDGWSADRAFAEMQQYDFGPAFLHSALKNFVYDYYSNVRVARAGGDQIVDAVVRK